MDKLSAIGSHTFLGRNNFVTKTTIGRYCSIGNNVSIGQGEHDLDRVSTSALFYTNAYEQLTSKPCSIGHDVWIGVDALVLRGVHVGTGSVVAANAVVNKDVPPYAIVGGVPARVIRYRFSAEKIKQLLDSKWWERDLSEAKLVIKILESEQV